MWAAIYIVVVLTIGFAAASAIVGGARRGVAEIFGICAILGLGVTGAVLLWLSMLGTAPSRAIIVALGAIAIIAIVLLSRFKRSIRIETPTFARRDLWSLLPLALIAYLVLIVTVSAIGLPLYETDGFAIWGFKARVIAGEALRPKPEYFHDLSLSYSHLDYPLLVPMLEAGLYATLGRIDDQAGKAIFPLMYVATGATIYAAIRRRGLSRLAASLLLAMLLGTPAAVRWAGAGVADIAIAMFGACAASYAIEWIGRADRPALVLAAASCALCAMTKLEGATLGILIAATLLFREPRRGVIAVACALIAVVPWILFSRGLSRTYEAYETRLAPSSLVARLWRLPEVAAGMFEQVVTIRGWGMLWLLLILAAVLGARAFCRRETALIWCVLIAQLLAYAAAYLVTPWDLQVGIPMTIYRVLLQVTPIAVLLMALHWSALLPPPRRA